MRCVIFWQILSNFHFAKSSDKNDIILQERIIFFKDGSDGKIANNMTFELTEL